MDKKGRSIIPYGDFSKELDFYDPVDQEIYILSLNADFQKAIKKFKQKYKIEIPAYPIPANLSYYPLNIKSLFSYSKDRDEKQLENDFMDMVKKTRFKNTRYSISIINGLAFYIIYGQLRKLKRLDITPIPPVKLQIKKHAKVGFKEAIRVTLDLFADTTEDEIKIAIHEHWKWVEGIQKKLLGNKGFERPAIKDSMARDSYLLYLNNIGFQATEMIKFLPEYSKLTPKEINDRITKIKHRVEKSFTL